MVTLRIGSINETKLEVEDNFGPLPPIYLLRYETSCRHKLKERHTKTVKDDDAEVETVIWDNTTAEIMG